MPWQQAVRKYVAVGKVKSYEKLFRGGRPLDLCSLCREDSELGDSVRQMVDQLFTNMVLTGVSFGWLSCFYATWLAWRPRDSPACLMLSCPFLPDSADPCTIAAMSWLQAQAITLWQAGEQHEPYRLLPLPEENLSPGSAAPDINEQYGNDDGPTNEPHEDDEAFGDGDPPPNKRQRLEASPHAGGQSCHLVNRLSADDVVLGDIIFGEGSTSQVVQGLCRGQPAAIKLLLGPRGAARAEREAAIFQVLAGAQARGAIPKLFGCGTLRLGTPFIATSLVAGEPLSEAGRLPPGVGRAARRALAAIHAAGVAHGDLQLCNIMLERLPQRSTPSDTATGTAPLPAGDGAAAAPSNATAGLVSRSDSAVAAAGPVRVTIIDLGRARTRASPDELKAEMQTLRRLLR